MTSVIYSILIVSVGCTDLIVTNNKDCTHVGEKLLMKGATAQEIYIATSVCEGALNPADSGIGGGFQGILTNGRCFEYLNFREMSSRFVHSYTMVGVPGVLKGYEYLYNNSTCGPRPHLQWSELFEMTIELLENGIFISPIHTTMIPNFEQLYTHKYGDIYINWRLISFLKMISDNGPTSIMHTPGTVFNEIVQEFETLDIELMEDDLLLYDPPKKDPVMCKYGLMDVYTTNYPGSGVCICVFFRMISTVTRIQSYSSIELFAFKLQLMRYIYAIQPFIQTYQLEDFYREIPNVFADIKAGGRYNMSIPTNFGRLSLENPTMVNQHGTSHINVKVGNVQMSVTSSINSWFGSKLYSKFGFFYNNQLKDFGVNQEMGKQPPSSMVATVLVDSKKKPVFSIGGTGGRKIVGSVVQVLFNYFVLRQNLTRAIEEPRCINFDGTLSCESEMDPFFLIRYPNVTLVQSTSFTSVTGSTTLRRNREAVYDPRRGGLGLVNVPDLFRDLI